MCIFSSWQFAVHGASFTMFYENLKSDLSFYKLRISHTGVKKWQKKVRKIWEKSRKNGPPKPQKSWKSQEKWTQFFVATLHSLELDDIYSTSHGPLLSRSREELEASAPSLPNLFLLSALRYMFIFWPVENSKSRPFQFFIHFFSIVAPREKLDRGASSVSEIISTPDN